MLEHQERDRYQLAGQGRDRQAAIFAFGQPPKKGPMGRHVVTHAGRLESVAVMRDEGSGVAETDTRQ